MVPINPTLVFLQSHTDTPSPVHRHALWAGRGQQRLAFPRGGSQLRRTWRVFYESESAFLVDSHCCVLKQRPLSSHRLPDNSPLVPGVPSRDQRSRPVHTGTLFRVSTAVSGSKGNHITCKPRQIWLLLDSLLLRLFFGLCLRVLDPSLHPRNVGKPCWGRA